MDYTPEFLMKFGAKRLSKSKDYFFTVTLVEAINPFLAYLYLVLQILKVEFCRCA